ncbi:WD40 repeat-like protein [Trametes elegans]|nr:WD40 repeat-like protein [Trametes elegans]
MVDPLQITADEVNCLIYSYFKDSGFQHSAFVLRAESRLEHSPHFRKHVARGQLVELLSKALLFSEVEAHWKSNSMDLACRNPFSILERHVCSAPTRAAAHSQVYMPNGGPSNQGRAPTDSLKRKAGGTIATDEAPKEKRAKTSSPVEIDVDVRPGPSVELRRAGHHPASVPMDETRASTSTLGNKTTEAAAAQAIENDPGDGPVQLLKAHKSEVFVCAWNPANKMLLASGSKDSVLHLWNLPGPDKDGNQPAYINPPLTGAYPPKEEEGDLTSLDWSVDGALLAIGCYDSVLRICDTEGKVYFMHNQHDGPIFAARFSASGRWLITASLDGSACVWDVQGKRLHRQFAIHKKCCLDVEWLTESEFASSGSDGQIYILNIDNPKPLKTLSGHKSEVNQLKCNTSRTKIASCSDDKSARIWNIADIVYGRPQDDSVVVLAGHKTQVSNIAWSPTKAHNDHELLVSTSFDGTARVWDSTTGECLQVLQDHKGHVYNLAFSPDGRQFATSGSDGCLFIYDVRTQQKLWAHNTGKGKRGIFEISWQQSGNLNRIAMALEKGDVAVVDLTRIPELQ